MTTLHPPHAAPSPRISVLMAARNAGPFIGEAVASILNQTEGDFELLVLDDGSNDDTGKKAGDFDDPRLCVYRNSRPAGVAAARNRLLEMARGEFIAVMDADDVSSPDRLALQTAFMREHPDIWACGGHMAILHPEGRETPFRMPTDHERITALLLFASPIPHPFAMFRGDIWRKHGIRYDATMTSAVDYELWQRIAVTWPEARFANLDAALGRYRRHAGSLSDPQSAEHHAMESRARLQTFHALGLSPAQTELEAHAHMYDTALPVPDEVTMLRIFDWAVQLRDANNERRLFAKDHFIFLLLQRLLQLTENNPQHTALSVKLLTPWKMLAGESQ